MNLHSLLNDGRSLETVSQEHPVLLLFLRQFGCIFCREAVAELTRLQEALTARGIEVLLVHQGTPQQADAFFADHPGGNFSRIADPDRQLYRSFDLKRVGLLNAFGIPMWLRSFDVTRQGHALGKLVGDGWQMPGCFIVYQGRILSSFPYDMVADKPDYLAFVDAALTQDLSQLAMLLPDGTVRTHDPAPSQAAALPAHLSLWAHNTLAGRPRLLLVGGNGSLPERFQPLMSHLRARFAVSVVELAGQGNRQTVPAPPSLDGFAQDLAGELAQRATALHTAGATGPLIVLGHGIGGLVLAHAVRLLSNMTPPLTPAALVLLSPVGVKLHRRRFPGLMKLPGVRPLARRLLGNPVLGSYLSRRLLPYRPYPEPWQEPSHRVSAQDRLNFARGYRQASSFEALFDAVDAFTALDGLHAVPCPVVLMWGETDPVLPVSHLAAWAEVFTQAPVRARLLPGQGHYPYLEDPAGFAQALIETLDGTPPAPGRFSEIRQFNPRSKGGRLMAMVKAGLPTPDGALIPEGADDYAIQHLLPHLLGEGPWAVRSSSTLEDQAQTTGAGRFLTRLEVTRPDLLDAIHAVRRSAAPASPSERFTLLPKNPSNRMDVVIQPMVARTVGGVAWVRPVGVDLELMAGGAEGVVEGREGVIRISISSLGKPWELMPETLPGGLSPQRLVDQLVPLLKQAQQLFDVPALDVEWCFHPDTGFTLLQARPLVEGLSPRRLLSAANIAEIIPPIPSPLLVDAAQGAAMRLPRYYARLDARLAELQEPFTCTENGRYFINVDLFAALFDQWGLPRSIVSRQVGGTLPETGFKPLAFLRSLPVFWRMLRDQQKLSERSQALLEHLKQTLPPSGDVKALAQWLETAYQSVVTGNFRISGVMALLLPLFPGGPPTVTHQYTEDLKRLGAGNPEWLAQWGHRGAYESDPAWPRADHPTLQEEPRAFLPDPMTALPAWRRALPWFHPRYVRAHREWFRDSSMRLWSAFRSRMRVTAQQAVEKGLLPDEEAIFSLGMRELMLPPEQWSLALQVNRRAPAEMPPPLFWSDSLQALDAVPTEVVIVRGGVVEGFALVARTPLEALRLLRRVPQAPILVAPAVGPGWEPVFQKVVGVVTELGGRLSHAALHLGEDAAYQMPVLFNLRGATTRVKTGEPVRMEAPPGRLLSGETLKSLAALATGAPTPHNPPPERSPHARPLAG